jgi:hypothetical protein
VTVRVVAGAVGADSGKGTYRNEVGGGGAEVGLGMIKC